MNHPGAQVPVPSPDSGRPRADREELRRVEAELRGVERALTGLDDGTYGTCDRCRVRLPDDVLAVDPLARRCPDHRSSD